MGYVAGTNKKTSDLSLVFLLVLFDLTIRACAGERGPSV